MNTFFKLLLVTALIASLTACETIRNGSDKSASNNEATTEFKPSSNPIAQPTKSDYLFVQTALTKLGFKPGPVDGFWGNISRKALDNFHRTRELPINNGVITEADIYYLQRLTNAQRKQLSPDNNGWHSGEANINTTSTEPKQQPSQDRISATKTEKVAPELVIVEQPINLLRSDNPFSRVLTQLKPGTSMYVLKRTAQWLLVETEDRVRGYIILN